MKINENNVTKNTDYVKRIKKVHVASDYRISMKETTNKLRNNEEVHTLSYALKRNFLLVIVVFTSLT